MVKVLNVIYNLLNIPDDCAVVHGPVNQKLRHDAYRRGVSRCDLNVSTTL